MLGLVLLAQEVPAMLPFNWQSVLVVYGPLGAIVAFVCFMIYLFAPKVVEGHLTFLRRTAEQGDKLVEVMDKFSDTFAEKMHPSGHQFKDHTFSTARTNKALVHIADLLLVGAAEVGPNVAEAVRPHVDATKSAINGKDV